MGRGDRPHAAGCGFASLPKRLGSCRSARITAACGAGCRACCPGRSRPGQGQGWQVVAEDAVVQGAQFGPGVEAEFIGEEPAQVRITLQRFGVAAGQVQGTQQQGPAGLAQRVLHRQLPRRLHGLRYPPPKEQGGGADLPHALPQLLQTRGFVGGEQVVGGVGERGTAPHVQGPVGLLHDVSAAALFQQPVCLGGGPLEAYGVPAFGRHAQGVAGRFGDQDLECPPAQVRGFQDRADLADVGVQGGRRPARGASRPRGPQFLAQCLGSDRAAVGEQQPDQQQPLLAPPRIQHRARPPHHQRTQQPEIKPMFHSRHHFHPAPRSTVLPPVHARPSGR